MNASSLHVTQANDYAIDIPRDYPFGMVLVAGTAYNDTSRPDQNYKFNGNEFIDGEGIPPSSSFATRMGG